ncbi:hypothetical protein ACVJBD_000162 [Rhizobium mongolense]
MTARNKRNVTGMLLNAEPRSILGVAAIRVSANLCCDHIPTVWPTFENRFNKFLTFDPAKLRREFTTYCIFVNTNAPLHTHRRSIAMLSYIPFGYTK